MLARNGEVTLDKNAFTSGNCALSAEGAPAATTTTVAPAPVTVTDITLPSTGSKNVAPTTTLGGFALILGAGAILLARRRRPAA